MKVPEANQTVNWLFLDLNAFFASCEQQENPALAADHRHADADRFDRRHLRQLRS